MAKQNGERYPPNSLYLICAIYHHLSETEGEDALNVLNKADKRQVSCNVFWMSGVHVDGVPVQKNEIGF